jgi:hypothetical protein
MLTVKVNIGLIFFGPQNNQTIQLSLYSLRMPSLD